MFRSFTAVLFETILIGSVVANHGHHHGFEDHGEPHGPPLISPLAGLGDDGGIAVSQPAAEFLALQAGESSGGEDKFTPFSPRFEVSRVEINDDEWLQELSEEFQSSGILAPPAADERFFLLKTVPSGAVNVNYDIHNCVHMGTHMRASETVYPPTAISFPVNENSEMLHTLVMLDLDNRNRLHWLVVNIPGPRVSNGQVVRGYNSPAPAPGTGPHRFVFLAMKQLAGAFTNIPTTMEEICKNSGRDNFNLELFKQRQHLSEPFAANYFTVEYDPSDSNFTPFCHGPHSRETLA